MSPRDLDAAQSTGSPPAARAAGVIALRPYQRAAIDRAREQIREGSRAVCLVAPCGAGKTVIAAEIVRAHRERVDDARVLLIVHRRELVDQAVAKLLDVGISAGVMMGDDRRAAPSLGVQVASIQTLHRRIDRLPRATLVVYDECHHSCSDSARAVLAQYGSALLIGLTATPWRRDRQGLADIYQTSVVVATTRELIAAGSLVPVDPYLYDAPDLHEVDVVAGDYQQGQLDAACNTDVLVGDAVAEYVAHADCRQAIVFPVSCEHSRHLARAFGAAGYESRHIDWSTPAAERTAAIDAFRARTVRVLCSVGVLTEGFDAPSAEVAILCRPTRSLSLYLQMVGRVLRPAPGKTRALIHDHGGNAFRFGLPDDDRDYSLRATPEMRDDVQCCTDCGRAVTRWPADGLCPACGSLQQIPAERREVAEARKGKDVVAARARIGREQIEQMRAELAERFRNVTAAEAARVLHATREEKAAEYLRLKSVAERKGFRPGFVAHQYRSVWGVWPHFRDDEVAGVAPALYPFLPLPPRGKTE